MLPSPLHARDAECGRNDDGHEQRDKLLREAWQAGMEAFLEALVDHEFYRSDYASKEQPS